LGTTLSTGATAVVADAWEDADNDEAWVVVVLAQPLMVAARRTVSRPLSTVMTLLCDTNLTSV
jgi:hypothetical protein